MITIWSLTLINKKRPNVGNYHFFLLIRKNRDSSHFNSLIFIEKKWMKTRELHQIYGTFLNWRYKYFEIVRTDHMFSWHLNVATERKIIKAECSKVSNKMNRHNACKRIEEVAWVSRRGRKRNACVLYKAKKSRSHRSASIEVFKLYLLCAANRINAIKFEKNRR